MPYSIASQTRFERRTSRSSDRFFVHLQASSQQAGAPQKASLGSAALGIPFEIVMHRLVKLLQEAQTSLLVIG